MRQKTIDALLTPAAGDADIDVVGVDENGDEVRERIDIRKGETMFDQLARETGKPVSVIQFTEQARMIGDAMAGRCMRSVEREEVLRGEDGGWTQAVTLCGEDVAPGSIYCEEHRPTAGHD